MKQKKCTKSVVGIIMLLFSSISAFAQFTITSPNATTIWENGKSCTITWTSAAQAPAMFNIRLIYQNGNLALVNQLAANVPSAPGTYTFTLSPGHDIGKYYTICFEDDNETSFGCSETFTIRNPAPSMGITENNAGDINVYPMPLTDASALYFTLHKTAPVKAVVYDMLGNEITCLKNETLQPGAFDIDLPHLAQSGIYVLRLEVAGNQYTRKLVVN